MKPTESRKSESRSRRGLALTTGSLGRLLLLLLAGSYRARRAQPPALPCPQEPSSLPQKRGCSPPDTWVLAEPGVLAEQGWALYSTPGSLPICLLFPAPLEFRTLLQTNQRHLATPPAEPKQERFRSPAEGPLLNSNS